MSELGRVLLLAGALIAGAGAIALAADRLGFGRLPGDLQFGGDGSRVHIPLATCLLISAIATVVLNLFLRR